MRAIAAAAGVAVETVYLHFRSKPALLKTLLDVDLGGQGPVPVAGRDWVLRVLAQPDAATTLAVAAEKITTIYVRLVPLLLAVRAAAQADTVAAEIWTARKTERLEGMGEFARHLVDTGELRAELSVVEARDRLFVLTSPETYGSLVLELGWTPEHYTDWLTGVLVQQLLAPSPTAGTTVD